MTKQLKILATSWHPGGINPIIPVIKKIRQNSLADLVVVGHEFSEKILKDAGIDYNTIQNYFLPDVSVNSMRRLLHQTNPNLILTGTSAQNGTQDVIEQTITLAAKEKQIPSISVLDVWMSYYQRFSDIYTNEKFKFLPTKIAIMDKYAEAEMLKEGFPNDKLVITGNPHFDGLEEKANSFTNEQKEKILAEIGLNKEIFIFYAANVWEQYKQEYGFWDLENIQLINNSINNLPTDYKQTTGLIVKLHPRTPPQDLEKINEYIKEQEGTRLVTGIHPHDLILASDLTLTPNSTVGFEAVYMHRPCISIQPGLKTKDYLEILTQNNLIPVGYTAKDCVNLIQRAVTNGNYRKDLVNQASSFRTDGKATQRVTNLVYEMLGI